MRDGVSYDELDAQRTADALLVEHATLVAAEARKALRVGHWADLHDPASIMSAVDGAGRALPGTERPRCYGGHGTPAVAEFAVSELAVLLGLSEVSAGNLLTDVLDLRHRHPRLWELVVHTAAADGAGRDPAAAAGLPRLWHLRQVVHATHAAGLTLAQARWVDARTAPWLATLPWSRFEDLLKATIIEADPDAARAREQAAATRRYVATGQTNEHGLKTLIAQAGAGDVIVFVAMLDRVAQCLRLDGDPDTRDVRRAKALGILANPAEALDLLLRHATTPDASEPAASNDKPADGNADDGPAESASRDAHADADGPRQAPVPHTELDLFDDRRLHPDEPTQTVCTGHPAPGPDGRHCDYCTTPGTSPRPRGHHRPGFFGHRDADDDQQALDTNDAYQSGDPGAFGAADEPGPPPGTGPDAAPDPQRPSPRPGPILPATSPDGTGHPDLAGPEPPDSALLRPGDLHPRHHDDHDDPEGPNDLGGGGDPGGATPCAGCGCPGHPGSTPEPTAATSGGRIDPAKVRPQAVLHVHVDQHSFTRDAQGVARFENGIGPVTLQTAIAILGHHHVTVRAVIDLPRQHPVDCYEAPARLRDAVKIAYPHSVFPFSPTSSRAATIDLDHPTPYRHPTPGQPHPDHDQGQTSLDNLAPLGRRSHRVKTHAPGWTHRQPTPGIHLWRTRHGYTYRVDAHGTHPLGKTTTREFQQLCDDLTPARQSTGERHFLRLLEKHRA